MRIDHQEPIVSTINDSNTMKNKGISAPFALAALAIICVLVGLILYYWPVSQALQVNSYQSTNCTILAKKLETITTNGGDDAYNPNFTFNVPASDGKSYIAHGYGLVNSSSGNKKAEQAILDSYTLHSSYPCWYATGDPAHAVLSRDLDIMAFAPGTIFALGGLFLLFIAFAIRPRANELQQSAQL